MAELAEAAARRRQQGPDAVAEQVVAQGSQKGQDAAAAAQWGPGARNRADGGVRRSSDGAVRARDAELSEAAAQWGLGAVAQSIGLLSLCRKTGEG
jgi:hypothetical protein